MMDTEQEQATRAGQLLEDPYLSLAEIEACTGIPVARLMKWARDRGISVRGRAGRGYPLAIRELVIDLWRQGGRTVHEIAALSGVKVGSVRTWVRQLQLSEMAPSEREGELRQGELRARELRERRLRERELRERELALREQVVKQARQGELLLPEIAARAGVSLHRVRGWVHAAGIRPRRGRRAQPLGARTQQIVELALSNAATLREIGDHMGMTQQRVQQLLKKLGAGHLRPSVGAMRIRTGELVPARELREQVLDLLRRTELPTSEIAARTGVSRSVVASWARAAGVAISWRRIRPRVREIAELALSNNVSQRVIADVVGRLNPTEVGMILARLGVKHLWERRIRRGGVPSLDARPPARPRPPRVARGDAWDDLDSCPA